MDGSAESAPVRYGTLLTDPALLSVFLMSGVAALGVTAVPVALPAIAEAFDLVEAEIGLVMSAFAFAVLVAIPVVGVLADLHGRRAVVIPSLLLFGASGVATLWATSYPALLGLRALQGVAFAGIVPLTPTLIGDLYLEAEGSTAQGIRVGFNGLAGAVSPLVAGVLVAVAWQYPFVLFAGAFPAAAVVYQHYPEPDLDGGFGGDGAGWGPALRSYWLDLWSAVNGRLALLVLGGVTLFFLKGGFQTFLPVFAAVALGASGTEVGVLLAVYGTGRFVVSPLSGLLLAAAGRRVTIVLGMALAALGMGTIPLAPDLWWLGLAAASYTVGEGVLNPVLNDAVAALATDDQRAGLMSGLQLNKQAAISTAPVLLGALIGLWGYPGAFLLAAALPVAYGLVVLGWFPSASDG